MVRADVSLEIIYVKLVKVCIVWLLIDSCFSINECNVSSRVFLVVGNMVGNSGGFRNFDLEELVVKVVHDCHFSN